MHPPRDPNNLLKLYKEVKSLFKSIDFKDPQILSASPPSVFIGRVGYPYVNVGILSPVRDVPNPELYDAPSTWSNKNYSINGRYKWKRKMYASTVIICLIRFQQY